ncbi:MAG: DUF2752 domain-containing protein [Ignavibacteriaceae bacterium]|nr:DUF2752 domain-containing protein [Ignavibacteriaceae bacterium]
MLLTSKKNYLNNSLMLAGIVSGFLFLFTGVPFFPENDTTTTVCIFKNITTIDCPGCGMSRASKLVFEGKIVESFYRHPLALPFLLICAVSFVWIIYDLITKSGSFLKVVSSKWNNTVRIILILIILGVWIRNLILFNFN